MNPTKQVDDVIDTTRQYHNLLQRTENDNIIAFTYDSDILSATGTHGIYNYYQDDLSSPLRIINNVEKEQTIYSYNEFGQDVYENQRKKQPFGYTGYERDDIAHTYYAQAREYKPENGRFTSEDIIKGSGAHPCTLNQYTYCFNTPTVLVDLDGAWPSWNDVKNGVSNAVSSVTSGVSNAVNSVKDWYNDLPDWGKNLVKIGVGVAAIGVGVAVTAVTGGAAVPALVAGLKGAAVAGAISAGTGAALTAGSSVLSGDDFMTGLKKTAKSAVDGFSDGFMLGGIVAGVSQVVSGGFKIAARLGATTGRNGGLSISNNLKILSPNHVQFYENGGTLIKIGNNFRLDVGARTLFHIHFLPKAAEKALLKNISSSTIKYLIQHPQVGTFLSGIFAGILGQNKSNGDECE